MPGSRPAGAGSRGPIARAPALQPSGYRISERRKFELKAAGLFVDRDGLQAIIDLAVDEFLDRLRAVPGYRETLDSAEGNIRRRAGIPQIPEAPT